MSANNVEAIYPLSPLQRGLLFQSLARPGSGAYLEQIDGEIEGELDLDAFRAAWQGVVDDHPILRTAFVWEGLEEPLQVVGRDVRLPWTEVDWRGVDPGERQVRLAALLEDDRRRYFDFGRAPLMRLTLIRLGDGRHHVVWSHHHILLDGWSWPLVVGQAVEAYRALRRGEPPPRSGARPYRDFIAWLGRRDRAAAERFWRARLEGFDGPVRLELGRSAGRGRAPDTTVNLTLSARASAGLERLAAREGVTLSALFHAAWALVLAYYTDRSDVLFGSTVAGRPAELAGVESMVGLLINTVPFRARVPARRSLADWLREIQAQQVELASYESAALADIHAWTGLGGDAEPFDSVIAFQNYPVGAVAGLGGDDLRFGGLRWSGPTGYPLTVRAAAEEGRLGVSVSALGDRFDERETEQIANHLVAALEEIERDPLRPPAALSPIRGAELHRMVERWNDTARPFPRDATLHELFRRAVDREPQRAAVTCGRDALSYAELDRASAQLAEQLRARGVRGGDRVGVCLPRGTRWATGLMAVVRAGAAYVPLDPAYPPERIAFMLEDAATRCVIGEEGLIPAAGATPAVEPVAVELAAGRDEAPPPVPPTAPALVIYTSGTTGRPKGVVLDHRGRVNNFTDFNARFDVGPGDSLLGVSALGFDMSAYDLFGTLAAGATLVLPPSGQPDPHEVAALLEAGRATIWHSTPALLGAVLDELDARSPGPLDRVRLVLLGGDWIPLDLPGRIRRRLPRARVISLGGATEVSMDSILYEVGEVDPEWTSIPYGRPMANQVARVLDRQLGLRPAGAAGELHLGGVGVAAGYWRRPGLTARKFVPDPYAGPGARLYATGDLARHEPDGTITLLGRIDHQVKLAGHRIEPGEVEAVLGDHPAVERCLVTAQGADGEPPCRLVAYVVAPEAGPRLEDELRALASRSLPAHMCPAGYVRLERLPLTPNGKVDRRALPAWRPPAGSTGAAPSSELERALAARWAEVLGLAAVDVDADFFALGGDSLAALRACRVGELSIPLGDLYEQRTVRRLARVAGGGGGRADRLLHRLTERRPGTPATLVCVPYGGGNAAGYTALARALDGEMELWAVGLPGHDPARPDEPLAPLEEVARGCADEIAARVEGPVSVYGHCGGVALAVELAVELERAGRAPERVFLAAALPLALQDSRQGGALPRMSRAEAIALLESHAPFRALPDRDRELVLRAFDHDGEEARRYFQTLAGRLRGTQPLSATIVAILADDDPCTAGLEDAHALWLRLAPEVRLATMTGGGHYFVANRAADVAAIVTAELDADTGRAAAGTRIAAGPRA